MSTPERMRLRKMVVHHIQQAVVAAAEDGVEEGLTGEDILFALARFIAALVAQEYEDTGDESEVIRILNCLCMEVLTECDLVLSEPVRIRAAARCTLLQSSSTPVGDA